MEEVLFIVVPCYNEREVLNETNKRLTAKVADLVNRDLVSEQSRILYVDDGSSDDTWDIINDLSQREKYCAGLKLSRNRGHQNALTAGLDYSVDFADMTISIDADLQDDVDVIDDFVEKFHEGFEVVYGVRSDRSTDSVFKRTTAQSFYKMMRRLGCDIVNNHADYRLLSKRVLKELKHYREVNIFLRGLVPMVGFKSTNVYYQRGTRFAGESKYPLKKMLAFAWEGITSLSTRPLRLISALGFLISFLSSLAIVWSLVVKLLGLTVAGWSSIVLSIWFLGGIQLLALGILGEYVGKVYLETKGRPRYSIERVSHGAKETHPVNQALLSGEE
ncbi:MAG: glycosyltransferase family 2 protein [Spirochaetales bacterium]|nr:glycosyltransferase family 2 protein [Spirochaetales bacterium]